MAANDRTASSRQLAARWSSATGALMSASSIRRHLLYCGLRTMVPLYRIPLTANHRWLRLQWAHEHSAWKAGCHQVVFSDESHFNLWNHDGRIRVRRSVGERSLPDPINATSSLSPIELVWYSVGLRLARDLRPAALKEELLLRIQEIWNSLPQADIQNLFDSLPHRIATLIGARGGYTKY
ncbi:transposable element Tcb2 transposase [Trichonephila clavipes]|nr:transposable element Tcb2 transposase [Trichonephila clavipes]